MANNNIFEELDLEVNEDSAVGDFENVELKTGIDPSFFAETMTTDVELIDAIFDLIDNSIDAARNIIISNENYSKDDYGLPSDYSGYEIKIAFSDKKISIADNCLGINSNVIESRAFYTGKKSEHQFGIGHYGLGLKRALLKAGKTFFLKSDNGEKAYVSRFSHNVLSGDKENSLIAKKYATQGKTGTLFCAEDLKDDVISQIKSREWFEDLIKYLSTRYSIFIAKGLKISVKNSNYSTSDFVCIEPQLPTFRTDGPLLAFSHPAATHDNVNVFFDVGVHKTYLFPGEYGSDPKKNEKITNEFGIYFIFNDRVIVAHSFEKKYGFSTSFHSEYNGFLCYIRMISENPGNLPWNTAKTEVKVHNPLFVKTKKPIELLASKYRSKAKVVINTWLSDDIKNLPDSERRKAFNIRLGLTPSNDQNDNLENISPPQGSLFSAAPEPIGTTSPLASMPPTELPLTSTTPTVRLNLSDKGGTRIEASNDIIKKLNELNSMKLKSLYRSLYTVSLVEHPILSYVGAWSFVESLCSLLSHESGLNYNGDFQAFITPRIKQWTGLDSGRKTSMRTALRDIADIGNASKHDPVFFTDNAKQLAIDFKTLEPIFLRLIDDILEKKKSNRSN